MGPTRRRFLTAGALAAGSAAFGPALLRDALAAPAVAGPGPYGPLGAPDANDLMLPAGFSSRLIARRLELVPSTAYRFPIFPDGQATYRTADGGWILVTNSESLAFTESGASGIRFAPDGTIRAAYPILRGTNANCAGGPTPWGTWLSCEEYDRGLVWECDPAGVLPAEPRPALGVFNHEAAAVDPVGERVYLTEDEPDGRLYRFTPAGYPDLTAGLLEVALVSGESVSWVAVPDPGAVSAPTREQVPESTPFAGGEGLWYARGLVYFTTKGDKRVWAYEPARERLEILYDDDSAPGSALNAVDNVTVSDAGEVFVCEDGGNMEIGLISPERVVSPFLRFAGTDHPGSEICGAAFDPSGTRLYLTSQRAFPIALTPPGSLFPAPGGAVYEVSGPFRRPSAADQNLTPKPLPAGEQRPRGPLNPGPAGGAERGAARERARPDAPRAGAGPRDPSRAAELHGRARDDQARHPGPEARAPGPRLGAPAHGGAREAHRRRARRRKAATPAHPAAPDGSQAPAPTHAAARRARARDRDRLGRKARDRRRHRARRPPRLGPHRAQLLHEPPVRLAGPVERVGRDLREGPAPAIALLDDAIAFAATGLV